MSRPVPVLSRSSQERRYRRRLFLLPYPWVFGIVSLLPRQPDEETPRGTWFTTTHWSVVLVAGQNASPESGAALEKLCGTYWPPLYLYIRRQGHSPADAQDLTQAFFAMLCEKNYAGMADPEKGRFRSFLLTILNRFLSDARDRTNAIKRGGGKTIISLDTELGEDWLGEPASHLTPEKEFQKNWAITLLRQALNKLKEESISTGKCALFEDLKPFLEGESKPGEYAAAAQRLGMTANGVAVTVHRLRQRYRELVRAEIANTVATPAEIEDELRHLFTVLS